MVCPLYSGFPSPKTKFHHLSLNNNNNNNNEAENKLKYKNLSIEIQKMWNVKCFVVPVIIGATGIVSKSLQNYL
jgi:hypothetical protein